MTGLVEAFADRLFVAVPPLQQEWQQYLESRRNHEAEGIDPPSIEGFLLRSVRSSEGWFLSGDPVHTARLHALLGFFESELGVNPDIDELIEHYYAGYLPEPGDRAAAVLQLLGPKLRAARYRQLQEDALAVPESTVDFLRRLADGVPSLRGRVAEHFERLNGRPLPHAFIGEVVFEAVDLVASDRAEVVRPLLGFLEAEYGVDADIDNVIEVSFIEMLPNPGERGVEIEDLLGPKLKAELERQRNWQDR
jgi:hypothetical protein